MKKRQKRLTAIADILLNNIVGSQDELLELLLQGGYDVTQATLSRDLKTLRTSKIPTEMGLPIRHGRSAPSRQGCGEGSCLVW